MAAEQVEGRIKQAWVGVPSSGEGVEPIPRESAWAAA